MARIPMVTRTITSTDATILCVNIESEALEKKTVTLPRTYADDKAIMKYIEKNGTLLETNLKPVAVVSKEEKNALYGMREEEFVKLAKVLNGDEADAEDDTETENTTEPETETKPKKSKK